jgi:sulfur-oxidizing protein SoxY
MLVLAASAAGAGIFAGRNALAAPEDVAREIEAFAGTAMPERGKVRLVIADRVENGSAVPVTIEVDSAMDEEDRVESVMLLAERNPNPIVATFHFSALSPAATVSTRIRLADTQRVIAVARMTDGSTWRDEREVDVAIGGCVT